MESYLKLIENLNYNPDNGKFYWLNTLSSSGKKGTEAGFSRSDGYIGVGLNGKCYLAHRLAWFYCYSYFPENEIDHINHDRADNRLINLREVSAACNRRNSLVQSRNKVGIKGVYWHKRDKRWRSYIFYQKKTRDLGSYKSLANAVCARLAAEQCTNWHSCEMDSQAFRYVSEMKENKCKG